MTGQRRVRPAVVRLAPVGVAWSPRWVQAVRVAGLLDKAIDEGAAVDVVRLGARLDALLDALDDHGPGLEDVVQDDGAGSAIGRLEGIGGVWP